MKPVQYVEYEKDMSSEIKNKIYKEIDTVNQNSLFEIKTNWNIETQKFIVIRIAPETEVSGYLKIKNDKSTVEFKIDISESNLSKTKYKYMIIDLVDVTVIDIQFISLNVPFIDKFVNFFKKNGLLLTGFLLIGIGIYMNRLKIANNASKITNNALNILETKSKSTINIPQT